MASFKYVARNRAGERIEGKIDATDRRAALGLIEKTGQVPVSVTETKSTADAGAKKGKSRFSLDLGRPPRMGTREVLTFSTELSDLLVAGMTLTDALTVLANSRAGSSGDGIIRQLRDDISQGSSLSNALAKHPRTFTTLYVNMIRAGEASGTLGEVLKRLVDHYELVLDVRDKVITALIYPAIVMVMGALTMIVCLTWVVPKFSEIFRELKSTLPLSTRILIGLSDALVNYGLFLAAEFTIIAVLAYRGSKTEKGRLWLHGFVLRLPLVKGVVSAGIYSNFARTLATLLANGVPVLRALGIVEQTVWNVVIANEIRNARDRVTDGTTISGPLAGGGVFPRMMTDMLSIGEHTGNVPGALGHVAHRYEQQLNRSIKIFTTALEPILIVVMAVLVGFVAMSILFAVFSMTNGLDAQD
ncbi:MAG: type II secretion system F family protein [bacterium]